MILHEIILEQVGLEVALVRSVVLESLYKEFSPFLVLLVIKEDICNLLHVSFWVLAVVSAGDIICKSNCSFRVHRNNLFQSCDPVGVVASMVAVLLDLLKDSSVDKTLDDHIMISTGLENPKSQLRVDDLHVSSKLGGRSDLVLF